MLKRSTSFPMKRQDQDRQSIRVREIMKNGFLGLDHGGLARIAS